jgi:hypothetical protein
VDLARPAIDALYEVKEFGGITIREIVNRRLQAFVGNDVVKFVQKMKDANHWLRGEGWAETLASLLEKKPDLIDQSTAPAVLGEFIREGEREVSLFDADESGYIPRLDLQLKLSAAIPAYFHRALRFALKDVVRLSNWADPDNYNLGKRIDSIKDVLRNHPDHIDWFLGEVNSTLRAFDMIFPRIDSVHLEASIETVKGLRKEVGQLRGEVRAAKKAAAGKVAEEAETK